MTRIMARKAAGELAERLGPDWEPHVRFTGSRWGYAAENQMVGVYPTDHHTYYAIIYQPNRDLIPGQIVARPPAESTNPWEAIRLAVTYARHALWDLGKVVERAAELGSYEEDDG